MREVMAAPGRRWERQKQRDGKGQGLDPGSWEYASLAAVSGSGDDKPGSSACLQKTKEKLA